MELTGTNRPKAYFSRVVVFAFTVWFLGSSPFFGLLWEVLGSRLWFWGLSFLFNLCVVLRVLWWCPLFFVSGVGVLFCWFLAFSDGGCVFDPHGTGF